MRLCLLAIFITAISLSVLVNASNYQSLNEIKQHVNTFLSQELHDHHRGKVRIKVGYLDPRLRLAPCSNDKLSAYLPPASRAETTTTIGVRCDGAKPWSLYVPVRVRVLSKVIATTRPLATGTIVTQRDLKLTDFDINRLKHGYYEQAAEIIGQMTKRALRPGSVITPFDVKFPMLVKRGQAVTIRVNMQGINATMQGVALQKGARGDIIRVRNLSSKKVIEAVITGPKVVQVAI